MAERVRVRESKSEREQQRKRKDEKGGARISDLKKSEKIIESMREYKRERERERNVQTGGE